MGKARDSMKVNYYELNTTSGEYALSAVFTVNKAGVVSVAGSKAFEENWLESPETYAGTDRFHEKAYIPEDGEIYLEALLSRNEMYAYYEEVEEDEEDDTEFDSDVAKARGVKDEPGTIRQRKNKYWYIKKPDRTWTLCFDPNKPGGRDKNNSLRKRLGLSEGHGKEQPYQEKPKTERKAKDIHKDANDNPIWHPADTVVTKKPKPEQLYKVDSSYAKELVVAEVVASKPVGFDIKGVNTTMVEDRRLPNGKIVRGYMKEESRYGHDGVGCNREYAAFLVDRAFGINRCPVVAYKEKLHDPDKDPYGRDEKSSWMQEAKGARRADEFDLQGDRVPKEELARLAVFDYIINNSDRHDGNFMVYPDNTLAAIDHGYSLLSEYDDSTNSYPWRYLNERKPFEPPLDILEKINTVDIEGLCDKLEKLGLKKQAILVMKARVEKIRDLGYVPSNY